MPAPDVREAADMAQHLSEGVRPHPGDGPGADSTTADPADSTSLRITGQIVFLADDGKDLFEKEPCVEIAQRIELEAAVAPGLGFRLGGRHDSRVEKDPDRDWHVALMNQIVEDDRNTKLPFFVDIVTTVLENHHAGRFGLIVLPRDINSIVAHRAREDFALCPLVFGDGSLRNLHFKGSFELRA